MALYHKAQKLAGNWGGIDSGIPVKAVTTDEYNAL